jgi:outer membrane putative beta-barrel porin/alpha-amylase
MRKKAPIAIIIFTFAFTPFVQAFPAGAQNSTAWSFSGPIQSPAIHSGGRKKDDFIKPSRPTEAEPADIQKAGVLQLEFGLDASFDAEQFRNQQITPLRLRFAAAGRLLLALYIETVKSQVSPIEKRMTGVGDVELGFQIVSFKQANIRPSIAFAYFSKLPTASEKKELGNGRTDHRVTLLISKQINDNELDFNATYLNVGRTDSDRRADGGQFALAFTHKFGRRFGVEGELAGQSLEYTLPRGVYPFGAVTYEVNRRLRFDLGVRFGIGAEAPKASLVTGVTVGLVDLYDR